MAQYTYSDTTTGFDCKPFKSREAAEKKAEAVRNCNSDSAYWLKTHGCKVKEAKVEVVPVAGGYKVIETIT